MMRNTGQENGQENAGSKETVDTMYVMEYVTDMTNAQTTETKTDTPWGETVRQVAVVPKTANFECGWNGFKFYTLISGETVAVAE